MSFLWIFLCIGVGVLANNRGRNGVLWGIIAVVITPLIAVIIVALLKDLSLEEQSPAQLSITGQGTITTENKYCPYCGGTVKAEASKCKHCKVMIKEIETKECRYCKEKVGKYDTICKHCNSDIRGT